MIATSPAASRPLTLACEGLHLQLAPAVGGSIVALYGMHDGTRVDWLRPTSDTALAQQRLLDLACFPLVPWCNRIRDGRASFAGRRIALAPSHPAFGSPHPLHGLGWLLPWEVRQIGTTHALLGLVVEASDQWPWRFEAVQSFDLQPAHFVCSLTLTNRDDAPMPAGIGHHPYFPRRSGARLQADTRAIWQADAELMPAALAPDGSVRRMREGVALAELPLDNNFAGWQHSARITWPSLACGLELQAVAPLDFLVVYSPGDRDFFCVEPVSQCTDAFNLWATHPRDEVGGTVLAPGQSVTGAWSLALIRPQG